MIPLVPIGKFFIAILSGWATYKIYRSWQKTKDQNLNWFYKFFISLTVIFILFLPLPFIKNLYVIEGILCLVDFLSFICAAYFLSIVLSFLNWRRFQKLLFQIIIGAGIILLIVEIIFFRPASVYYYQFLNLNFIGWAISFPIPIRIALSILLGISAFIAWLVLLLKSLKIKESYLKYRGLFLSASLFFFTFLTITYFIFGSIVPTSFLKDISHLVFSLLGIVSALMVIYFKQ
jgi:hypothetical protein